LASLGCQVQHHEEVECHRHGEAAGSSFIEGEVQLLQLI
jgi:hypothetical protein